MGEASIIVEELIGETDEVLRRCVAECRILRERGTWEESALESLLEVPHDGLIRRIGTTREDALKLSHSG